MNPSLLPDDDAARVRLLHELKLEEVADVPGLDALARLAAAQTGAPMAGLSLVDANRQWFKASVGLGLLDMPRDIAFCSQAILSADVLLVPDALQDRRFASHPWVTGELGVRFYAGAPVRVEGHAIGTVCCLDRRVRELHADELAGLRDLAELAASLLHQRLIAQRLALHADPVGTAGEEHGTAATEERRRLVDRRAAELAHVAKSEFLSRMSHEMRTPLNAVIGFTQLLLSRQGPPDAEEVRDYAEHVLRAGEHLLAMTNDVLDLQHVEEGRVDMETVDVPLETIVAKVIELLAAPALERCVSFDNHVPAGVEVRGDERRLRQVLLNIGSNAVKYTRPAGVVRWSVDTESAPGRVRLSVEDTGSGLKPSQLGRLFQPFERLGKETSSIEGTGLGLIIARSLVVAMGGTLEVASSAGVGTRVVVELPRAQQTALPFAEDRADSTSAATDKDPAPPPTSESGPVLRLLYVEDNRINAILFEEAIRLRDGVELRLAEDGAEALEQVRQWKPDVLVLDAHLPGMDGFELLSALRREPGLDEVPAFMCSADAMPDDVQRAAAAGFAGYWSKPINIARIMSDLDRISQGLAPTPPGDLG
jgi:signal transduction histidine kinase/ActR/RegA family two-component response regulator